MKKKILTVITVLTMLISLAGTAQAQTYEAGTDKVSVTSSDYQITPFADVIVYEYRISSSGILQYRRWNQTRGYWVDPYWITIG